MKCERVSSFAVVAITLIVITGCGKHGPQPIPTHGRITLRGGDWPTKGAIYFVPVRAVEGFPLRPGTAEFTVDGNFSVKTPNDGLFPGEYRAYVTCWAVAPTMDNPMGKSHVPPRFRNPATSGLELVLKPDESSHEANFDVPKE